MALGTRSEALIIMILFLKHIDIEGPGTIETYVKEKGIRSRTIALHKGEKLPETLTGIDAVIVLGGPMNVYEEDNFPFLKDEDAFIKKTVKQEVPYLGICLGSQLLSKACGAQVGKSPVKEVGWFRVNFTPDGQADPLFKGLQEEINVYHWHEDMFFVPPGAKLLATAPGCPHQALKVGKNAYGVQFHIEVTDLIIKDWCKAYFAGDDPEKKTKAREMIETYGKKKENFDATAWQIYDNFFRIMIDCRVSV